MNVSLVTERKPTILGQTIHAGEAVELSPAARRQGVYLIGTTGCGKTTLLQNIINQDFRDEISKDYYPGLCVIDPHGDFIDELLALVPKERKDDVILFSPGEDEQLARPLGLNLLACDRSNLKEVDRVTSTVVDTLRKLFFYSWGPRMEDLLRHSVLTLLKSPDTTFLDLLMLLVSEKKREDYTKALHDPLLESFWKEQFGGYDKRQRTEVVGSSLNKIGRFLANPLMRRIISQPDNAFDMGQIMNEGKILLVNLSKGDLGEDNAYLLGAVLVNLILIAALKRRSIPPAERRPFHLVVDEFQNFATESFAILQSEARKYAIDIIVAHQYRDQLDEVLRGSTLNVANFITMRTTGIDSSELASQFDNRPDTPNKVMEPLFAPSDYDLSGIDGPLFEHFETERGMIFREKELPRRPYSDVQAEMANRLTTLPNYHAICRLVNDKQNRLAEDHIITLKPRKLWRNNAEKKAVEKKVAYIKRRSASLGKPQAEVDAFVAKVIGSNSAYDSHSQGATLSPNDPNSDDPAIMGGKPHA